MTTEASRRAKLGRVLFAVVLVAGFVILSGTLASGLNDDAYIAFRYAVNLARGEGLVFQPGAHVEGFTSFSWVMLAALFARVGLQPAGIMPLFGLGCGAALVVLVARAGQELAKEEGRPHAFAGVPAALFVALTPSLAFYAATGLETALAALLQTLAAVYAQRRRPLAFGLAAGLAVLTRPEAALVVLVGLAGLLWHERKNGAPGSAPRRVLPAVLALLAIGVPFAIFKLAYFGHLLPNTFSAKTPDLGSGLSYASWRVLPLVGLGIAAILDVRRRGLLFAIWAVSFAGVALEGGDWMTGSRMVVPSVATLALAADRALVEPIRPWNVKRGLAWLATALGLLLSTREALLLRLSAVGFVQQTPPRAELFRRMWTSGVRSLGTLDIGLPGYLEPDLVLLDLGGLTDRTIAGAPGAFNDKTLPMDYVAEHAPDAFVFTALERMRVDRQGGFEMNGWYPVETKLSATPWFHEHYRPREAVAITPDMHLVWFEKKTR